MCLCPRKVSENEHESECGISPPNKSEVAVKCHPNSKTSKIRTKLAFMNRVGLFERKLEPFLIR